MGDKSKIEWTDATWNPIAGCSIVSKGCTNCYAMKTAARLAKIAASAEKYAPTVKTVNGNPVWTGKLTFDEKALVKPLSWQRPRMIFVNSMSDLFHENILDSRIIDKIFAVMALTPQHTYQVLTKRPQRMRDYFKNLERLAAENECDTPADFLLSYSIRDEDWPLARKSFPTWPLPNVWLGVSVEDQATANERIPLLLETPAAIRFISAEPLIAPVKLPFRNFHCDLCGGTGMLARWPKGKCHHCNGNKTIPGISTDPELGNPSTPMRFIDWVICGGESGPDARPMHPDWARTLRDQCAAANVPFFFKQWGEYHPGGNGILSLIPQHRITAAKEIDGVTMYPVGKKLAGNYLDGCQHLETPETTVNSKGENHVAATVGGHEKRRSQ